MKTVFLLVGLLLQASARFAADETPNPVGDEGFCLPKGSEPLLVEVKADFRRHRLPFGLRLLGFSRSGRIALLEQRQGEETAGALWFLRVVDLDTDRAVVERELTTRAGTTTALCRDHAATIRAILTKHQIETASLPPLVPFPVSAEGGPVAIDVRRGTKEDGITPYQVWMKSSTGSKRLGTLHAADAESGQSPLSPPVVLGALRSPWEPRLAVLIRQDEIGIEAAVAPVVRIMGARLNSRWRVPGGSGRP